MSLSSKAIGTLAGAALALLAAGAASADWRPAKPIEFVATAGPGGGTDNLARTVQSIVTKHRLTDQPILVTNKGGGSGAEGYVYGKSQAGDPYKVIFGTSNAWTQPLVSKVAFNYTDLTPVAALASDEFLLWVKQDSPYKTAKDYIEGARQGGFKMGGAQSKDTDELLTRMIAKEGGIKITYIPFKSGAEAAVQLAGGHIDSNTNNPSESIGHWKAGQVTPLCVFSKERMAAGPKVTATQSWADVPTCKEQGAGIEEYRQPRTVALPPGSPPEAVEFWAGVLKKVTETPEWKDYLEKTAQTGRFLAGADLKAFIDEDEVRTRKVYEEEGWLVN